MIRLQSKVWLGYNLVIGLILLNAVRLDDSQVGIDFLFANKIAPVPHLRGIMVMDPMNPCFLLSLRS